MEKSNFKADLDKMADQMERAKDGEEVKEIAGEIKYIGIKEFVEFGFLQELNRVFLHPLGLALEARTDENGTPVSFGGVWDSREDPEGFQFGPDMIDIEKMERVYLLLESKKDARAKLFGHGNREMFIQAPGE